MTQKQYIEEVAKYVKKYAPQYGIKVYSPIIAQFCHESGYGTSNKVKKVLDDGTIDWRHNYVGLKWRNNRCAISNDYFEEGTSEQNKDGSYTDITSKFFRFKSLEECVIGYFQFTNISSYANLKGVTDPETYLKNIKEDKYATSIDYVQKNMNVISKWNLTQYDKKEETKMGYTNSSLVTYTNISPNKTSPRNHKLDTITIHCIVGQWTAKQGCDYFANSARNASCNYVVGKDGSIGLCVEEKDRSWCTSTSVNDHRAITIEVASDTTHPYAVTDKALEALIKLCADICKRNGIKALKWSTNKNDRVNHLNGCNMTVHRDFAAKACPGEFLYSRHGYIADEVNKLLGVKSNNASTTTAKTYTVVSGDTLSKIGTKTGVNWKVIAELNGIKAPYIIKKGQVLKLSEGTTQATATPSTTPNTSTTTSTTVPLKITQSKKEIQKFLNTYYGTEIKKVVGALLSVDGDIGKKSKLALGVAIQVELNKLGAGLDIDGKIGSKSTTAWNKYIGTLKSGSRGIFVTLWQCILVGHNYDPKGIDGSFGKGCKNATDNLFGKIGLTKDSSVSGSDINALL